MTLDKGLVGSIGEGLHHAPISADRMADVMLDYVIKVTKDATKVWKDRHGGCGPTGSMTAGSCRSR